MMDCRENGGGEILQKMEGEEAEKKKNWRKKKRNCGKKRRSWGKERRIKNLGRA